MICWESQLRRGGSWARCVCEKEEEELVAPDPGNWARKVQHLSEIGLGHFPEMERSTELMF